MMINDYYHHYHHYYHYYRPARRHAKVAIAKDSGVTRTGTT